MVNFEDPVVVEQDIQVVKDLWHTISGIYLWEFVTCFNYEWDIIRGRRPYLWTIWLYSLTRFTCLGAVILLFVGVDISTPYNCQAWIVSGLTLGYVTVAVSSLLIILRIIAIWNKNRFIMAISVGVWVANVSVIIRGLVRIRATWVPGQQSCIAYNIETSKLNIIATFVTNVVLLFTVLVGLFRLRLQSRGTFGRLLWTQGVIWFILTTLAGAPPAAFIILDLNYPFNVMFQPFTVIVMGISAQRLYRGLADFSPASADVPTSIFYFSSLAPIENTVGTSQAVTKS